MRRPIDSELARLAAAPTDHRLDGLETAVVRDIAELRRETLEARALAPARALALALAVLTGLAVGGGAALNAGRTAAGAGVFAAADRLAPSTLLDDAG